MCSCAYRRTISYNTFKHLSNFGLVILTELFGACENSLSSSIITSSKPRLVILTELSEACGNSMSDPIVTSDSQID